MKRASESLGGVYSITSPIGRQYIGGTINFVKRWRYHQSQLRRGKHQSKAMQQDHDALGANAFVFTILLVCRPQDLLFYEQCVQRALKPCYNTVMPRNPLDAPILTKAQARDVEVFRGDVFVARRPGRPPTGHAKEQISVRLDPDVLAVLRRAGPGWQSQINTLLRTALKLDLPENPTEAA